VVGLAEFDQEKAAKSDDSKKSIAPPAKIEQLPPDNTPTPGGNDVWLLLGLVAIAAGGIAVWVWRSRLPRIDRAFSRRNRVTV
jgi:hypothetical protein